MATKKYEHLVKPLSIGAKNWDDAKKANQPGALAAGPGNASREFWLNGRDHLEGLKLNFSWGVHKGLGDWHAGLDPHVHPYLECLMFVGLDTANVNYLGAEIHCCLGMEQETYTFNEPTVIVVPAGLPHGPMITNRIYSPKGFGFLAVELNSTPQITWLGEGVSKIPAEQRKAIPGLRFATAGKILRNKPTQATGKYAHLVKSLKSGFLIERGKLNRSRLTPEQVAQHEAEKRGPGNADHMTLMSGKDLEDLKLNISWGFCSQPGIWRRGVESHVHKADEVLIYVGTDPDNMDYLGAEIEFDMGKEHEKHLINQPTVIICPAGTPHEPQVTRWVDRPYGFFAISL
jgi:hypothetical protein